MSLPFTQPLKEEQPWTTRKQSLELKACVSAGHRAAHVPLVWLVFLLHRKN